MNKIINSIYIEGEEDDLQGSIWVCLGVFYILARVDEKDKMCLISLNDGNRLNNPSDQLSCVVNGATFVARKVQIELKEIP